METKLKPFECEGGNIKDMTKKVASCCEICKKRFPIKKLIRASIIRPTITGIIEKEYPHLSPEGFICQEDLNKFRTKYVYALVEAERGELTSLEKEVVESISRHEILATEVDKEYESLLTFGQKLSDRIAHFGGSWTFIIFFTIILTGWVVTNSITFLSKHFDPYPYILLNLILSCLAALQAPIIMMSQNRQDEKDRLRAMHDYQINLKAELEIRHLHEKIDHLLSKQWERLISIQEVQLELLSELNKGK
jgi:uncharacterized membrane protein